MIIKKELEREQNPNGALESARPDSPELNLYKAELSAESESGGAKRRGRGSRCICVHRKELRGRISTASLASKPPLKGGWWGVGSSAPPRLGDSGGLGGPFWLS